MNKRTNPANKQHTVLIIDSPISRNWDDTLTAYYHVSGHSYNNCCCKDEKRLIGVPESLFTVGFCYFPVPFLVFLSVHLLLKEFELPLLPSLLFFKLLLCFFLLFLVIKKVLIKYKMTDTSYYIKKKNEWKISFLLPQAKLT